MTLLAGKRVVLGVTGGIAAYKSVELLRLLTAAGAHVRVAMSRSAAHFVGPATFEALSGAPVFREVLAPLVDGDVARIAHVELAAEADVVVVAPATADALARMAAGRASEPVDTVVLATAAPVVLAPAMESHMWEHPLTRANVPRLRDVAGYHIDAPGCGALASGRQGVGRMAEPEEIAQVVEAAVAPQDLAGRSVLVSAGPTREPVDPVRVLTNRSSGRMGYALARAAAARGARVVLVSGPVELAAPWGVERVGVETAAEMAEAVLARAAEVDVVIMAAAVADFRPVAVRPEKIKKDAGLQAIELARTTDILAALAQRDVPRVRVGFAAETEDLLAAARRKLSAKRLAMIVANRVGVPGTGFDSDENEAYLVVRGAEDEPVHVPRTSKMHLAHAILDHVAALMRAP